MKTTTRGLLTFAAACLADFSYAQGPAPSPLRLATYLLTESAAADDAQTKGGTELEGEINKRRASRSIEEIIVTAQKRDELLQDVPISVAVLGGDDLDAATIDSLNDLISQTPGVYSYENGQNGGTKFAIRGVTSNASLVSGSSTVGYYLDEVPFGFVRIPVTPDANAYDLERVEVLRGPQGTLYGANSLNGVVRIITKSADLDKFDMKARVSSSTTKGGDWNHRGDLAVGVPIVEGKLAARAVLGYLERGGWIDQPITGKSDVNSSELKIGRFKVHAKPVENMSVELQAWLNRDDRGSPSVADDNLTRNSTRDEPISTDYDTYGATINYEFPSFSVMSATSYMDFDNVGVFDLSGLDVVITTIQAKLLSQEIRLQSNYEGQWQWSFGGMYRDAEDRVISALPVIWRGLPADRIYGSQSYAVFGEVKYSFMGGLFDIAAGLRYFEDDTTARELSRGNLGIVPDLTYATSTFDAVTPRLVFSWHPSDHLHLYTSYSQGFRSGFALDGTVLTVAPTTPPVKEDMLTNYELGAKGGMLDGRISYEATAYYIDWKDTQQQLFVPNPAAPNTVVAIPLNGESISGVGFDLSLAIQLMERLNFGASASWNDLGFDAEIRHPNGTLLFREGERPDESPETTLGATLDYSVQISGGFETRFSMAGSYTSKTTSHSLGSGSVGYGDSFLNIGVRAALLSPRNWTATLYADNVKNENPRIRATPPPGVGAFAAYSRVQPRTIGLQIEYRY